MNSTTLLTAFSQVLHHHMYSQALCEGFSYSNLDWSVLRLIALALHFNIMFWELSLARKPAHSQIKFPQEADEVASQVQQLKQQLGTDHVDQLVEDYPRLAAL